MSKTATRLAMKAVQSIAGSIELVLIDLAYGKSKYRRRGAKLRPIVHKYFYKTVYVRPTQVVYNGKRKESV